MFRTLRFYHSFFKFLSTPSSRRATGAARHHATVPTYFYPRPPRGGRPGQSISECITSQISIHALREEGDVKNHRKTKKGGISIHALREEGDAKSMHRARQKTIFLSTPSARRATVSVVCPSLLIAISIHALREEGDCVLFKLMDQAKEFLSTPSARRATLIGGNLTTSEKNFYPRPPRGGRPSFAVC